jgi:RNA 2',3'-cyclic 3'-phosphodiesterase
MREYEEVWRRFEADRRLEFGGHRDPSWSHGHECSASFSISVDAGPLIRRLAPLREALEPFPSVSMHPDRFLHITLIMLGFPVEKPRNEGEISRDRLAELDERARRAAGAFPAFTVELANLNAFPAAAFVEVHDGGKLRELRSALSESCDLREPSGPPHLTLAYFQAPDGTPAPAALVETIRRYRDWPVGSLDVESVALALLDLTEEYPEPETLAALPLARPS